MNKSKIAVLADSETWSKAGEELRVLDPQRYIAILQVVEDICNIHRNPLGAVAADGFFVFPRGKTDDYD